MSERKNEPLAAESRPRTRACARVTVRDSKLEAFDQTISPALLELHLNETFAGDIAGESTVRALQVRHDDRSVEMVSLQRVRGTLAGREGSFVLQGTETIANGTIKATWFVVPRSGSGELSGLRGEGGSRVNSERARRVAWTIGSSSLALAIATACVARIMSAGAEFSAMNGAPTAVAGERG